ncbi:uncharacterized protein MYCFIDRAFT_146012, partial [Pseudocercospora fijiensis CIRAD86]
RDQGSSISSLVSTLVPVFVVAAIVFLIFLVLRKRYQRVYAPRTYLASLRQWELSPKQNKGAFGWRRQYMALKDEFVMGHASLDNYLWLRFFRMLAAMCVVGCLITWPILFPVNATGNASDVSGLDILSFSNITPGPRYYAQVFVAWIFLAWVMFVITRESKFFVRLRQHYYSSPYESACISTRSILFVNVPEAMRNEDAIRKEFSGVRKVWLVNVPEDLAEKVKDRDTAAQKLEAGEVKLIRNHVKRMAKEKKKGKRQEPNDVERNEPIVVKKKDRPSHRLPKLQFLPIGKKVDTVDWARAELSRLLPEIRNEQNKLRDDRSSVQGACFVEFETVRAAHIAVQKRGIKNKAKITPKEIGPAPENVIWPNIIKPFWKVQLLNAACTAFVYFLCIFWTIPVAVIGAITNIDYLTSEVPFLSFIDKIPKVILGLVTGLLPVLLLSILMTLVPILCNTLAKLIEPTHRAIQLKVQTWYFPFQVIQVFLITTFSSGAASVTAQIIQTPPSAPTLLAQNLPKASNFYISYFILFGLLSAALEMLNVMPLLGFLVLGKLMDTTPRKLVRRYITLAGLGWGSLYPKFTNLGVIALSYSCIAPLVLGFAAMGFFLLYLAFRYHALFTLGTNVSTRGESYARALRQLITGIYLCEICLIGLFAIGVAESKEAIGALVLMVVFLFGTVGWQLWLWGVVRKMEGDFPSHEGGGEAFRGSIQGHADGKGGNHTPSPSREPTPQRSFADRFKAFLFPETSAAHAARMISSNLEVSSRREYTEKEHAEAYIHPAIFRECPVVWIARDEGGLSKREILESREEVGEGLEMTDEGAWITPQGKLEWTENPREAPIWEGDVKY